MTKSNLLSFIESVLSEMPDDWLNLTTHRLDIYNEELAKVAFIQGFETLYGSNEVSKQRLQELPTAYDYIRLGHPLSSVLEWSIAKETELPTENIISFSSSTAPLLAVLRKNLLDKVETRIVYSTEPNIDWEALKNVYGYSFELLLVSETSALPPFAGSTVLIENVENSNIEATNIGDFQINLIEGLGSIIAINPSVGDDYISEIQHFRRRETIAMTPADCLSLLHSLISKNDPQKHEVNKTAQQNLAKTIQEVTQTISKPLIGSSGLSIQYSISMGLIDKISETYPEKEIKIIIPPNCYGGTNDQARRISACLERVEVVDLPVDREQDMVSSVELVLTEAANLDAVPLIIVEIPTNPRVEVPNLLELRDALTKKRITKSGKGAISPIFIIDQTFCPNVPFLSSQGLFRDIEAISYVSGSKFPSGGKCTAGYCVANEKGDTYLEKIEKHLKLCDNEATGLQMDLLAEQMPSMIKRIETAYHNTRDFVKYIGNTLPEAKINFVSEELAKEGFTPSVFSLDLPVKGNSIEEKEAYKRALNDRLINMMITQIPEESKYCVSYGQLKGCYWTIPATSTQGTTKEEDKDYIARVALSPSMDLQRHKEVFEEFVASI
ncbi:MAG: cystathionine beta-synthase [Ekhidna sp.]|nr:cystathionine beta-synthase [Ekhidna sp.]